MSSVSRKEKDAIIRMMIYIKYELVRSGLEEEAILVGNAIESVQIKLGKPDSDTELS